MRSVIAFSLHISNSRTKPCGLDLEYFINLIVFIPQNPLNFFSVSLWPPWVGWGPGALCHQWPRHTHKERNRPRNRVFHATILTHQVGAYQSLRSCLRPAKKNKNGKIKNLSLNFKISWPMFVKNWRIVNQYHLS